MISDHHEEPVPIHSDSEAAKFARLHSETAGEAARLIRQWMTVEGWYREWLKQKGRA